MKRLLALVLLLALAAPASGMETILTARAGSMQAAGTTHIFHLSGAPTALTPFVTAAYGYTWMPAAGTLSGFTFLLSAAPGSGEHTDFVIYQNASSAISFSISDAATTATPAGSISVAAGDYIYVAATASAGAATADAFYYCTFSSTTSGQSLITGGSGSSTNSTTVNNYAGCMGVSTFTATANDMRQVVPTGGSISNLYVSMNSSLTGDDTYTVNLYVNGSASALTALLAAGSLLASDTSHSVSISAGDLIAIETVPGGSPSGAKRIQWGMRWTPTTDGEGLLLGGSGGNLHQTATRYNDLNNSSAAWNATESAVQIDWPAVQLKKFFVTLSGAPGSGNNYAFTIRDDGAGSALTLTIADAATAGSDEAHTVTPGAGSLMCLEEVPTSTPDVQDAYWGVVAYIAPAASTRRIMVVE